MIYRTLMNDDQRGVGEQNYRTGSMVIKDPNNERG